MFFGDDYRVLRGGSWATSRARGRRRPSATGTFPERRQIFAGVRIARDADEARARHAQLEADMRIDCYLDEGTSARWPTTCWTGSTRPFKELPPKHFYDARGAELFDRICELPEYYPTRVERAILGRRRERSAAHTGAVELVELGSGTAAKTRVLLDALYAAGTLRALRALRRHRDDGARLRGELIERVPGPGGARRGRRLRAPPATAFRRPVGPRIVLFLGGTIGNFTPGSRRRFLRQIAASARPRRPPAARHRPGQGPARARGRLRRRRRA